MIKAYFFKLTHSPLLYIGFLAALALSLYSINGVHNGGNVFANLNILISIENYRKMFVLFAALPFASNFADEWNSKTVVNCITRKDGGNYAVSNVVICYLSAFAVVFAGIMIYIFVESTRMPMYNTDSTVSPPYGILCENGAPMLAITLIAFVYAMSCAMWAVMGLAASAFFPSKYVALCAPFVFSYIIERFTKFVPGEFQLGPLSQSWSGWQPLPAFLKSVTVFLVISLICAAIFTLKVKRRVENELS